MDPREKKYLRAIVLGIADGAGDTIRTSERAAMAVTVLCKVMDVVESEDIVVLESAINDLKGPLNLARKSLGAIRADQKERFKAQHDAANKALEANKEFVLQMMNDEGML